MFFKVKLSLIVDAVLPSGIALQQSRPRQPQQALAEPQNTEQASLWHCSVWTPVIFEIYIYTYIYMIDR